MPAEHDFGQDETRDSIGYVAAHRARRSVEVKPVTELKEVYRRSTHGKKESIKRLEKRHPRFCLNPLPPASSFSSRPADRRPAWLAILLCWLTLIGTVLGPAPTQALISGYAQPSRAAVNEGPTSRVTTYPGAGALRLVRLS